MKKLLIRPRPFIDESLASLLHRASDLNKTSKSHIYSLAGLISHTSTTNHIARTSYIQKKEYSLTKLSELLDISEKFLWKSTFTTEVSESSIFVRKVRYCPSCLKEGNVQYLRKIWDIIYFTVCPKHNCLLIDKCPNCEKLIVLSSFKPITCKCGFILSSASPSPLSKSDGVMSKVISEKIQNETIERRYSNSLNNTIFEKNCYSFLEFTKYLLGLILYRDRSSQLKPHIASMTEIRGLSMNKLHANLKLIMRQYIDWPNQLDSFLQGFTDEQIKYLDKIKYVDDYLLDDNQEELSIQILKRTILNNAERNSGEMISIRVFDV